MILVTCDICGRECGEVGGRGYLTLAIRDNGKRIVGKQELHVCDDVDTEKPCMHYVNLGIEHARKHATKARSKS